MFPLFIVGFLAFVFFWLVAFGWYLCAHVGVDVKCPVCGSTNTWQYTADGEWVCCDCDHWFNCND